MVIADTGFWLALANKNDHYHRRAKETLLKLEGSLITTWPVMTETCHMLLTRLGLPSLLAFLKSFNEGAFKVYDLKTKDGPSIYRLMEKYQDLPMDLADASLVILAEHLGKGLILSTDERDFKTYRFKNHKPFKNLLLQEEI